MRTCKGFARIAATIIATLATTTAQGWDTIPVADAQFKQSSIPIGIHGFTQQNSNADFSLTRQMQRGTIDFKNAAKRMIRNSAVHPLMGITNPRTRSILNGQVRSESFNFHVGGIPVCNHEVKAHRLLDGTTLMLGRAPAGTPRTFTSSAWDHIDDVTGMLNNEFENPSIINKSRCLFASGDDFEPAWNLLVRIDGLPWQILANGNQILASQAAYFTVEEGTARVFENNKLDGNVVDVVLPDLKGDGTLTSTFLKSMSKVEGGHEQTATAEDQVFAFDPEDDRYDEVAAYAYAQIHYDFFKSIGFQWYGPTPLEIKVHEKPGGQINNALFVPADSSSTDVPTIFVGDGDGVLLRDLGKDADVVAHEFGHHVIYQTLKSTKGESLVLHEGLADFFAFMRTDDGCLGESICPDGSTACWVQNQCLRTADNDLSYMDDTYKKILGHHRGQMISGMLWDIKKSGAIPKEDLLALTYTAIEFFEEESGFRHFMLALFHSDKALFKSAYFDVIREAAEARGLGVLISDVEAPDNDFPLPKDDVSTVLPVGDDDEEKSESKSDDNFLECAVIGGNKDSGLWMLLLLLVPVAMASGTPGAARVRVRSRRQNRSL